MLPYVTVFNEFWYKFDFSLPKSEVFFKLSFLSATVSADNFFHVAIDLNWLSTYFFLQQTLMSEIMSTVFFYFVADLLQHDQNLLGAEILGKFWGFFQNIADDSFVFLVVVVCDQHWKFCPTDCINAIKQFLSEWLSEIIHFLIDDLFVLFLEIVEEVLHCLFCHGFQVEVFKGEVVDLCELVFIEGARVENGGLAVMLYFLDELLAVEVLFWFCFLLERIFALDCSVAHIF
jgi:hypothetical protein